MKVVLIYRHPVVGAYSLEELFHTIAGELKNHVDVIEYEVGPRWNMLRDAWQLRKLRADIYHVTGDITYITLLLPLKKTVLTIPDIGCYLFGFSGVNSWKRIIYKWLWLLLPIKLARAVTAISLETQENIVKHLGFFRNRIEVIECCYSALFKPVHRPFNDACPEILQVGTKPYKNVPRLVEALRGIKCRLLLIGHLDDELKQQLLICNVNYVNRTNLSHEEIVQQYVDCDIVSFVSIGEGFGVPIIEAQACGRPVITANVSPMSDVAGDGACLVDPLNVTGIREGILKIINDPTYRNQLVERGIKNANRYSPATISDQYLELYRRIV